MKTPPVYGTLVGSALRRRAAGDWLLCSTDEFDSGAAILLAIFSLWQMLPTPMPSPFSALRIIRRANIPVMPVVKGISVAKNHDHAVYHRPFGRCHADALWRLRRI